jgi:hypothetical protein
MEQESLMNRINTIAYLKHRHMCNCTIGNVANGEVSVKTTKPVKPGAMQWTKCGNAEHYYEIQYYILQKRLRLLQPPCRNDNSCRGCGKRHVTLYVCDSCLAAICPDCLSQSEKYILDKRYFFCKNCMVDPPLYMNRFAPTSTSVAFSAVQEKEQR